MDTRTQQPVDVSAQLQIIKTRMPETYKSIQEKASKVGNKAYELVRRALRGEPNCFWAMENGHVVGTPFSMPEVSRDLAQFMVSFGCAHVCTFVTLPEELVDGKN